MFIESRAAVGRVLLLALWCVASTVHAVNLGGVRVLSQAGEPLRAEIGLTGMSAAEAGSVRAALASPDIFAASGLTYPPILDTVKVTIVRAGDGFALRLTSELPATEALLSPVIELTVNGVSQLKSVSLPIPGGRAPTLAAAPAAAAPAPMAAGGAEVPPWPVPGPNAARVPAVPVVSAATPTAPMAAPAPRPAAPAPVSAPPASSAKSVAADITEAIKQQIRQEMHDGDAQRALTEAQAKIAQLSQALETMNKLLVTQQRVIEAQAGIEPAGDTPRQRLDAAQAGFQPAKLGDSADPPAVVVTSEREGVDLNSILLGAAGAVLALAAMSFGVGLWQRRRARRGFYLPAQ